MAKHRRQRSSRPREVQAPRVIDYNDAPPWDMRGVQARYQALRARLGGVEGFAPEPLRIADKRGGGWVYNIMDSVTDGVQLGDAACIELAVCYLEADGMASGSGYRRARMARALCHAALAPEQCRRLRTLFLEQLRHGRMHQEYREYIRLFRHIGVAPHRGEIAALGGPGAADYVRRAVERLLA